MPRRARQISSTKIYHVVIKGAGRELMFEEKEDYEKYLDILRHYKSTLKFELYAYCLMSNHVHLLIHTQEASINSIFRHINTKYAIWFNMKYNRTGSIQDGRYFSEPVEDYSYFINALKYIHFNPVKAGLEASPGEKYPWSSYHEYLRPSSDIIGTDYLYKVIGTPDVFKILHCLAPSDDCLEVDKVRRRIPDDVAQRIIYDISKCSTSTEFQNLSISDRNKYIREIHNKGVSIRQLNRLTGISRGIIERLI